MDDTASFPREQLEGFALAAGACAAALANQPSAQVVDDMRAVAEALGIDWFADVQATPELEQRYYDRFVVSSHPAFVPLCEDCVRGGYEDGDRFRYGKTNGRYFDHVLKCYRAVGFDYRAIEGYEPVVNGLKPDSLTCELAFLVFLAQQAVALEASDAAAAQRAVELLREFADAHARRWFADGAACLARFDDDFYAKAALLAATVVEAFE